MYIGTQVSASICAAFMLKAIFEPIMGGGVTVPTVEYAQAFALEFIISFNLMFVVTAVATDTRAVSTHTFPCFCLGCVFVYVCVFSLSSFPLFQRKIFSLGVTLYVYSLRPQREWS